MKVIFRRRLKSIVLIFNIEKEEDSLFGFINCTQRNKELKKDEGLCVLI
jgi:hypothetical protein